MPSHVDGESTRVTPPFELAPPTSVGREATWTRPVRLGEARVREWTERIDFANLSADNFATTRSPRR